MKVHFDRIAVLNSTINTWRLTELVVDLLFLLADNNWDNEQCDNNEKKRKQNGFRLSHFPNSKRKYEKTVGHS